MKAGSLDRRITLLRGIETRNQFNEPILSWAPVATVWASKEDIRDAERVASQEVGADITSRFQIRYSSAVADVNPKDRLQLDDKVYDIVAVKEIGRRDGLEISAIARADQPAVGG
jgi:SPP1 family predicted phage head-tail adaptor